MYQVHSMGLDTVAACKKLKGRNARQGIWCMREILAPKRQIPRPGRRPAIYYNGGW